MLVLDQLGEIWEITKDAILPEPISTELKGTL